MMNEERSNNAIPRIPSGFQDAFAADLTARQSMIEVICKVYQHFGFAPLETPAIEYLDVLGKFLPESNEPQGGVFALKDDDKQWISLRYDLTAPLSRVYAQYDELPSPYRRYQVGPVWRREKPGPGRFRQFYQCDFDTVGSSSMAADAEVCAVLCAAFEALGIAQGDYEVRVNNRKVLNGVLEAIGIQNEGQRHLDVLRVIDKLDRLGLQGVRELLGTGRLDQSGDFTVGAGLSVDQAEIVLQFVQAGSGNRASVCQKLRELVGSSEIGLKGVSELETINELLDTINLGPHQVKFDPTVVRGLGYYTGPVFEAALTFEVEDEETGKTRSFGSVAGGGRYDDLVRRFTGNEVPATGASIGVDRLLAALKHLGRLDKQASLGPVVVTVMDQPRLIEYQRIVGELRDAGIRAELYLGDRGFRAQMKYADKRDAPVVVIVGEDEFNRGEVTIKDMRLGVEISKGIEDREKWRKENQAQTSVPRSELVKKVQEIVGRK